MRLRTKLVTLGAIVSLTGLLAGCGDDSENEDASNHLHTSAKPKTTAPFDIQGYYEATVFADNGDNILLNLMVRPNGEYFGLYNNSFADGNYKYNQEIMSLVTGKFTQNLAKKLTTRVREFDAPNKSIRNYKASIQAVPKSRLTLDLTNTDASIDKKVYDLRYVKLDSPVLSEFIGSYDGVVASLTKYTLAQAILSDSDDVHIKNLKIKVGDDCEFTGTVIDAHYDANFYPYSGSFNGSECTTSGKFTGVMYKVNNLLFINGVNTNKTDIMRFNMF